MRFAFGLRASLIHIILQVNICSVILSQGYRLHNLTDCCRYRKLHCLLRTIIKCIFRVSVPFCKATKLTTVFFWPPRLPEIIVLTSSMINTTNEHSHIALQALLQSQARCAFCPWQPITDAEALIGGLQ